MAGRVLTIDEIMAILPATPDTIADLTKGLTAAQLQAPPQPEAWSVNDVLAHLRACNDVLGGNAIRIVTEDHPAWRGMSPRTWQRKSGYHDWEFEPAFVAFRTQRADLLAVLEKLEPAAWERTATVRVPPGKVYEYSAHYYGDWLAGHERAHLKSLPRIIAGVTRRQEGRL